MKTQHKYLGLDVHKETIVICIAEDGRNGNVRQFEVISNDLHALERTLYGFWQQCARGLFTLAVATAPAHD